ncbi:MAG: hypothetical protein QM675_05305 [Protaetiibacter sp.]
MKDIGAWLLVLALPVASIAVGMLMSSWEHAPIVGSLLLATGVLAAIAGGILVGAGARRAARRE